MFSLQSIVLLVLSYVVIPRLTFLPKPVHALLTLFGPFLLPLLVNSFNTSRAQSRSVPIRPAPYRIRRTLDLLLVSAAVCLVLSLPNFGPENIFLKTQSRLQIDPNVLFTRLRHLRPLTNEDELLRAKLGSMQNKLIYLAYGPDTLLNCIWCSANEGSDATNFFLYSLPKIFTPHILHLAVLGLSTSSFVGSEGARFRTHATIAGLLLLVSETWYLASYNTTANKRAKALSDIDFVHWRLRVYRLLAFAAVDGVLGLVLWLTSTNRWLAKSVSIAERIETITKGAESTTTKLHALGLLANSINRDQTLRNIREGYWRMEGQELAEVVQEEEVMTQINAALGKLDMQNVQEQIRMTADTVLADVDSLSASKNQSMTGSAEHSI